MSVNLAVKTMSAIENTIAADQGASFRVYLGQILPHMKDAYQGANEGFRTHLGASVIGKECARQIWYGFRWALKPKFSGRILRLFNRGHLEEARFIAMLLAIGVQVFQQDSNGNQFRISDVGGHFGGSGDGVGIGIPDLPAGLACLLEFKTHGEKSFIKLQKEGVRSSKPEHYVQMQVYLRKMALTAALYGAVNKNTDEVYLEIVYLDSIIADQFLERGHKIIMMKQAPDQLRNSSPGLFACRYCDMLGICHNNEPMERNCRTCYHSEPTDAGNWICNARDRNHAMLFSLEEENNFAQGETLQLTKARQLTGCKSYYTPI